MRPDSSSVSTVSLPFSTSVAPVPSLGPSIVRMALSARRSGLPSVSVPPSTCTVVAAAVPSSRLLPVLVSAPVPRFASTVPPLSA